MSNKSGVLSLTLTKCKLTILQVLAIIEADIRKLRHDPSEMFMRMTQPIIWLLIFGESLANARALTTGSVPYMDYIAPGILAQSTLFVAIFYGIALIWEKDMGILQKVLVTPTPRAALVVGRSVAAGFAASFKPLSFIFFAILSGSISAMNHLLCLE